VVQLPVGIRDFVLPRNVQKGSGAHPAFYFNGCGGGDFSPGVTVVGGVKHTTHLHVFWKLKMIGAVLSLHHTLMPSMSALGKHYLWRWLIISVIGRCKSYIRKSFAVWNETVKISKTLF
jgi:hypothetical protein